METTSSIRHALLYCLKSKQTKIVTKFFIDDVEFQIHGELPPTFNADDLSQGDLLIWKLLLNN